MDISREPTLRVELRPRVYKTRLLPVTVGRLENLFAYRQGDVQHLTNFPEQPD